uniref:Uncharacterized protein n=1 Tax=Rhizophora mucronata TaxID=61149 RepID=A0A2P2K7F2_RHIMU
MITWCWLLLNPLVLCLWTFYFLYFSN